MSKNSIILLFCNLNFIKMKKMMNILLFLIISLLLCYSQKGESCFLSKRKHVHVVNGLPPNPQPLMAHCKSRDDDLGTHALSINQSFNFNFCIIAFETLFHCDVQWEGKGKNFTAFTHLGLLNILARAPTTALGQ